MGYWFEDPFLKALAPLALSTSIKGLTTIINVPKLYMGANVFPEGMVIGPTTMDALAGRAARKRAFIVTDSFSERFAGKAVSFLKTGGFETRVWPKALPEAPMESVRACAEDMSAFEPDLIMAVGGGSAMDTAKAAWILYERPDLTDIGMISPLDKLELRKKAFLVAVPTTSGTGSECTGTAVVHDSAANRKIPLNHDDLVPDVAILTPDFAMTMPPGLTAGTGLDVLAHAMDAVTCPASNDFTDPLALRAIEMVFAWLPRAYKNGGDREARYRMHVAASIAGVAFGMSGTHLTHSFGHSLGAAFELHHGLCVGFFIPHSLRFCRRVTDKYLSICKALEVKGRSDDEKFEHLVSRVQGLLAELDVPPNLREMGISPEAFQDKFDNLVAYAVEDVDCFLSPRPITEAQCAKVFRYAYEGKNIDF